MILTPRELNDKIAETKVPLSIAEKLMWFERWKNETGINENMPANVQMWQRIAEASIDYYYTEDGGLTIPPPKMRKDRCGTCFLWQRKKGTACGTCVNGQVTEQDKSCAVYIPNNKPKGDK